MLQLLVQTRLMNLILHDMHNKCGKIAFLADHTYFAELYEAADDAYDSLAERAFGLSDPKAFSLPQVLSAAAAKLGTLPQEYKDNGAMFQLAGYM